MRYLLLRLRSRLVAAYDRQSRKRQFANADRADQTTRRPAMIDGSTYGDHTGFVTGDCSDTSWVAPYGLGMGVDSQETNCTFGPRFAQTAVNNKCGLLSCPFCVTS